jgi:hypothetical protein
MNTQQTALAPNPFSEKEKKPVPDVISNQENPEWE